jgi:hypothetical protein
MSKHHGNELTKIYRVSDAEDDRECMMGNFIVPGGCVQESPRAVIQVLLFREPRALVADKAADAN